MRFAIYFIEADSDVFDPAGTGVGSFTWHAGESYRMLAQVTDWVLRVLYAASLKKDAKATELAGPMTWAFEQGRIAHASLGRVSAPTGELVAMGWHQAVASSIDDQLDERFITCALCSI